MNMLNVGYDSTNYYLLEPNDAGLLVDVGFPGTLPKLTAILKRKDIALQAIRYLLITHYHPDHAGLAQEMKAQGVRLIVMEPQLEAIPKLASYMKPINPYLPITLHDNLRLSLAGSRDFLHGLGIAGEIIHTPGHSEDSVSLVLENGDAFTGDLSHPALLDETTDTLALQSWDKLRACHAKTIYAGHGPPYLLSP